MTQTGHGREKLTKRKRHKATSADFASTTCAFCDNGAGSPEHVFPRWLLKEMKRLNTTKIYLEQFGKKTLISEGQGAEVITYTVCKTCNTGWMSNLERKCAPILKRLINGAPTMLSIDHRMLIATWLVKTSMVEDTQEDKPAQYFSREARVRFKKGIDGDIRGAFPYWMWAWAAAYIGEPHFALFAGSGTGQAPYGEKQIPVEFYALTLSAGHLILQMVTTLLPFEKARIGALNSGADPRFNGFVIQVFPIDGPIWPPEQIVRHPGMSVDDFAKRWFLPATPGLQGTPLDG